MMIRILFLVIFSTSCTYSKSEKTVPELAEQAFAEKKLKISLGLYKRIAFEDGFSGELKSGAFEKISYIFSQFYQDYDSALFYSLKNLVNPHQYCLASGYFLSARKFPEAVEFSQKALQMSINSKDSIESSESYARAVLKYSEFRLQNRQSPDTLMLANAWRLLSYCYGNEPESPYINEKRLETAMLLNRGNEALQSWKDYFLIADNNFPASNLQEAYNELESVLKNQRVKLSDQAANRKIILALSKSRFFPLIESLSYMLPIEKSYETDCILAFCRYRKEMENHIYGFFRDVALNRGDKRDFQNGIKSLNLRLWEVISQNNDKKYTEEEFRKTLMDRFGTILYFHTKGKIHAYFAGSAVIREVKPFELYGHKASFNFSQIDFVFGNVFDFWYNNEGFLIGGWNEDGENSHFRRNTVYGPVWVWNERMKNQELINKWKSEIDKKSLRDDSIARIHPIADLPGLRDRLDFRFNMKVLDSLKLLHLEGAQLRAAFIKTLWDYDNNHNYWHEGRHNLDGYIRLPGYPNQDSTEFWAKLAQISFAWLPSLELRTALNYNPKTGPKNGHTAADAKIVRVYYNWMNSHKNEIKGLDPTRPLLCQLDLLTEEQIRNIARSMDPLYRKSIE